MPAATLQRLEVWTDYQCNAGSRLAVLPLDQCPDVETIERVTRDDEGTIVVPKEANAYASLDVGRVIRFLLSDGSFSEWRIYTMRDSSTRARLATVLIRSVLFELQTAGILQKTTAGVTTVDLEWKGLTPTDILTEILSGAPAYFSAGTVTPTIPCDLAPSGWTRLRALRELVAAIRAQAVAAELTYSRNGTTGYFIDVVTAIGSSAAALSVRSGKNLLGLERSRERERFGLEVVPLGPGSPRATMARAYWECTVKSGTTLTMAQPVTGGPLLAFDDQLNTNRYIVDDVNAKQQITDSIAATNQIVVASSTNITQGRLYRIAANSAGDELIGLRKDATVSGPVQSVESATLSGHTNLLDNPSQRKWTGASTDPPDGWTKLTAAHTLTRTTTAGLWLYGGKSCRCQCTVVSSPAQCLKSPIRSIYVPAWATSVTYTMWIYLGATAANPAVIMERDSVARNTVSLTTFATGVWHRIDWTESLVGLTGSVRTFDVYLTFQAAGNGDVYVDSGQVTFTAAAVGFMEGSEGARLWALANRYLQQFSSVPATYRARFADLGQWSPSDFPFDAVEIGQTANVYDEFLGVTTSGRIQELHRDWKNVLESELTVATRPDDLVSYLSGINEAA